MSSRVRAGDRDGPTSGTAGRTNRPNRTCAEGRSPTDRPGVPALSPAGTFFLMKMQFPTENLSRHSAERRNAAGRLAWGLGHRVRVSCAEPAARTAASCASHSGRRVRVFPFNSKLTLAAPIDIYSLRGAEVLERFYRRESERHLLLLEYYFRAFA